MFRNKGKSRIVFGTLISGFAVLAFALITSALSVGTDSNLQDIIKKIEMRQQNLLNNVQDLTFMAKTLYKETDKGGNTKKDVVVQRRIYMKNFSKRHEDYLSMMVNGKQLDKKELEKESKEWRKKSRMSQTKMPLSKEAKNDYEYKLIGSSTLDGMPVWLVGFKSKKNEDNYINGKAYVLKDSCDIARVDFKPAKTSSVIKDIDMSLIYSEIQGYWLPIKFEMNMDLDVKFVLNMYYRQIKIEDVYTQYKFNCGLQDSLFDS
jgi:hypothetical protein